MDLQNPRWMYVKAGLFVLMVLCCFILIWASARAYYFAFYVIERYVDPQYRFSGLIAFSRYVLFRRR